MKRDNLLEQDYQCICRMMQHLERMDKELRLLKRNYEKRAEKEKS